MKRSIIFCILVLLFNCTYAKDISYLKNSNSGVNSLLRSTVKKQHPGLSYNIMETKRCGKCKTYLSLLHFHSNKGRFDGLSTTCKKCSSDAYHKRRNYTTPYIADLQGEIWKDVVGYEGHYLVSNLGRIKSTLRMVNMGGGIRRASPKLLTGSICKGYRTVLLTTENKRQYLLAHRLVAIAFMPNPKNHYVVNHLDSNPLNNCVSNLEWTTFSGNMQHASKFGNMRKGAFHPSARAVEQYTWDGVYITEFSTISEAVKNTTGSSYGIWAACTGNGNHSGGFRWRYKT